MPALVHAIGFDDAPFPHHHRGNITIIGTIYARTTLHGVVSGQVRRDGRNSTDELTRLVSQSAEHLQLILLQGIALAGFNVIDIHRLHQQTTLPVLVVARKPPNLERIKRALLEKVPGGKHKWHLIQQAGAMEPCATVHVQRAGLSLDEARDALQALTTTGHLPEPLRAAHLIAGGITRGTSKGQRA